ncbi:MULTISPECIES: type II secretion system F family protein [Yersinia]|uniref:Type IV pilus integral membrane protein n=2 Tax=Yersinia TaxID=629 RepID=A0A0T9QW03_9GAMM|nr:MULTISPECIES: type II secretion system F family protein [Yersinia]MBO1551368.1 general secretion pathway protein GspF [Yersinia pseudotuberculosis]MBO1562448.1 general secretion pathway protein GspF [Yersinia pseudotuberculosis]MBO1571421.1 general secretion pathway protein GspF [Yersinia pseudotuberculosis]MBO1586373.1 general secretion pathway protein GspF [Yersinia pseudotuberculosis]MBO1631801.1 type II secretion system F family protein [Yersinia pseudotuberculosis]
MKRLSNFFTPILRPDLQIKYLQPARRWLYRHTFSTRDRLSLYEDLAFLLDNNRTLEVAITNMRDSATDFGKRSSPSAVWLNDCLKALSNGQSLDVALGDWIPRQEAAIISAGVLDGHIADALRRAMTVVQGIDEMKSSIYSTLGYPLALIATVIGIMNMVSEHFIPQLAKIIPRTTWEGGIWWLGATSDFVVNQGVLLSLSVALLTAWITWSFNNMTGKTRRGLDYLIPWSIYKDFQGVAFLLNIAALLRADVKTLDALDILSRNASPWLLERLNAARRLVRQGQHLGLALRNTGYHFPSKDCVNKLVLLTDGDNAAGIIENYAKHWMITTIKLIKRRATRLSIVLFLVVSGYMFLLVQVIQQLNSMAAQMGQ